MAKDFGVYEGFGQRFRLALEHAGYTKEKYKAYTHTLCKLFDVSTATVNDWLWGRKLPAMETAIMIAMKLNVCVEWLLTGKGSFISGINEQMDKYENRRLSLLALKKKLGKGAVQTIAGKIGKDPTYVSRMLMPPEKEGRKRITEDFVDLLDEAYPGWLYGENTTQQEKFALEIIRSMHPTYSRLLDAASHLKGWKTQAEIARQLNLYGMNVSVQVMNNWNNRGVSAAAMFEIAVILNCRPSWLNDGQGPMTSIHVSYTSRQHQAAALVEEMTDEDAEIWLNVGTAISKKSKT